MQQRGQVLELRTTGADGRPLWAYRHRLGGRGSKRVQRGGFASKRDAEDALRAALQRIRRRRDGSGTLTLAELVEEYLRQHDAQPETNAKLRWLLSKSVARFAHLRPNELEPRRSLRGA
jgi:hypothetical protein